MGGTRDGGLKASAKVKARDPYFYVKIGRIGGTAPKTKPVGFQTMTPEQISEAGRKGGYISRKSGPNKKPMVRLSAR